MIFINILEMKKETLLSRLSNCAITILLSIVLLYPHISFSQAVGISNDNSTPDPSSILDVKSISKGILIPRMSSTERTTIASPANGLLVYDNTTASFWFHNGSDWINLLSGISGWCLIGNSAGINDFIGTTNNQSLLFKANNQKAGEIDLTLGNTFWGSISGASITTGTYNTAIGLNALRKNKDGSNNTVIGQEAMNWNSSGSNNTAQGRQALFDNTTGSDNTAIGNNSLYSNTTGYDNTANG